MKPVTVFESKLAKFYEEGMRKPMARGEDHPKIEHWNSLLIVKLKEQSQKKYWNTIFRGFSTPHTTNTSLSSLPSGCSDSCHRESEGKEDD
ncbi:hypothetical protein ACTXT7_003743 [Hymenolepis weldensis]